MIGWLDAKARRGAGGHWSVRIGVVATAMALGVLSTSGPALADNLGTGSASPATQDARADEVTSQTTDLPVAPSTPEKSSAESGTDDGGTAVEASQEPEPTPQEAEVPSEQESTPFPEAKEPQAPAPQVVEPSGTGTTEAPGDPDAPPAQTPSDVDAPDPTPSVTLRVVSSALGDSNGNRRTDAGEGWTITWRVVNESAARATGVRLTSGTGTTTCRASTVEAGKSTTCSTSQTLSRLDVDSGTVSVSARATATVGAVAVNSRWLKTSKKIARVPALEVRQTWRLTKDKDGDGRVSVGDSLSFRYLVRNIGNVTLKQPAVKGTLLSVRGVETKCRGGVLHTAAERPGQSVTCWSSDVVVKAPQLRQGSLTNAVTVTAETTVGAAPVVKRSLVSVSPLFPRIPSPSNNEGSVTPKPKPTGTPRPRVVKPPVPKPGLSLVTRFARVVDKYEMNGLSDVGDEVYLDFVVTNSGEVSLSSISVSDRLLTRSSLSVVCPVTSLGPGASMTCHGSAGYTVRRSDFHLGSLSTVSVAKAVSDRTGRPIGSRAKLSTPLGVPTAQTLGSSSLAYTGASTGSALLLGFGFVGLGATLLLTRRRIAGPTR